MATSRGDGAISGVAAADGHVDKATAVSDEEAPLIHAVYPYYRIVGGTDWLQKELWGETVIARLSRAPDWLYARRFDDDHQLVKGATRADVPRGVPERWGLRLVGEGKQVTSEFETGYSAVALAHLRMVAEEWPVHPGKVFDRQVPSTGHGWGFHNYARAGGTMTEAIVRRLFGVTIEKDGTRVQPRLRKCDGQIRAFQPATGLYVAYDYTYNPDFILLDYGSNHPAPLEVSLLLPPGRRIQKVSLDDAQVRHQMETLLLDTYGTFRAPSGVHRALVRLQAY